MALRDSSDLFSLISAAVYAAGRPPLDPACSSLSPINAEVYDSSPIALPSSCPSDHWSEPLARHTLASLCLVNTAWCQAAKPWLWRSVYIRFPKSWLALIDEVLGGSDLAVSEEKIVNLVEKSIHDAAGAALARAGVRHSADAFQSIKDDITKYLGGPDGSIPPELLSPVASRDPSPRGPRGRRCLSQSPVRWRMLESISRAANHILGDRESGIYISASQYHSGRLIRHLDFSQFRTVGMRRSIEEQHKHRYVTGDRLEALLKEMPNLLSFGATEYMDSALSLPVLEELLLRGTPSRGRGRRGLTEDDEDRQRRRDCRELQALDLTGCVSSVFLQSLEVFVGTKLSDDIAGLKRLSLCAARLVKPLILERFVLAFPSLTHLDLSCTRASPSLLECLRTSSIRLNALGLSRCTLLTGDSIREFLLSPPCTAINQLNLFGDTVYPSPLTTEDLRTLFERAPCFTRGALVYLDLSSAPLNETLLIGTCPPQPTLRSLGLSHIDDLSLSTIAAFTKLKAFNVEILTIVGCNELRTKQPAVALHANLIRDLCAIPFSIRPNLSAEPASKLHVIELSSTVLRILGCGAGAWRVVKSRGGRGWYVLSSTGWCDGVLRRNLDIEHPLRLELAKMSDANGNIGTGIGWHSRKMEVLHGYGMLGRESGLYGAFGFAYNG